jgi:hypothetical protein
VIKNHNSTKVFLKKNEEIIEIKFGSVNTPQNALINNFESVMNQLVTFNIFDTENIYKVFIKTSFSPSLPIYYNNKRQRFEEVKQFSIEKNKKNKIDNEKKPKKNLKTVVEKVVEKVVEEKVVEKVVEEKKVPKQFNIEKNKKKEEEKVEKKVTKQFKKTETEKKPQEKSKKKK